MPERRLEVIPHACGVTLRLGDLSMELKRSEAEKLHEEIGRALMPGQPADADLCDQREQVDSVTWVCTEALGHDDGGWHYDPVERRWWKRAGVGLKTVPDSDHRTASP